LYINLSFQDQLSSFMMSKKIKFFKSSAIILKGSTPN